MRVCGGVEVQFHTILTSALDGGEWSASRPGRLTPGNVATFPYNVRNALDMSGINRQGFAGGAVKYCTFVTASLNKL
jgi:hypothetical protein